MALGLTFFNAVLCLKSDVLLHLKVNQRTEGHLSLGTNSKCMFAAVVRKHSKWNTSGAQLVGTRCKECIVFVLLVGHFSFSKSHNLSDQSSLKQLSICIFILWKLPIFFKVFWIVLFDLKPNQISCDSLRYSNVSNIRTPLVMTILYPWGSLLKGTEYFFWNVHWHNVCRRVSHVGLEMHI